MFFVLSFSWKELKPGPRDTTVFLLEELAGFVTPLH
jgi:hypothetical protein